MSLGSLSEILGYISIGCWLFAQFPQVIENYKRKSCQGLAWPFLLNWLLGDASNLIGCLLTNQLPFQTWLAVYFVFVDCSLFSQYAYYERNRKPFSRGRATRTVSTERRASTSGYRSLPIASTSQTLSVNPDVHGRHITRTPRRLSMEVGVEYPPSPEIEDGSEIFDTVLTQSHHSDRPSSPKRVPTSVERHLHTRGSSLSRSAVLSRSSLPSVLHVTSPEFFDPHDRLGDASRSRNASRDVEIVPDSDDFRPGSTKTGSKHPPRGSTGAVFLSLCLVCGIHLMSRNSNPSLAVGGVLPHSLYPRDTIETERIIGRIFAWLCTALYLTSRLPQIWKNFVRKSVDGLSMYLFFFAFLGNTFYVASILTSPKVFEPGAADFIRESIPYLLGSAGTLMFDVTILVQSMIYRKPIRRHSESWTRSRLIQEEERGLLGEPAL